MRITISEKLRNTLYQMKEDLDFKVYSKTVEKLIEDYPEIQKRLKEQDEINLLNSIGIWHS